MSMKDIDAATFTALKSGVKAEYSDALVTGEYVQTVKSFPCVSFLEISNEPFMRSLDLGLNENLTRAEYQIEIYTRGNGKKKQARTIFALVDEIMSGRGFIRTFAQTVPNFADETGWRLITRYRKTI